MTSGRQQSRTIKYRILKEQHFHGEYWDYWRETLPASVKEFVFIELNADTGWFQIWRGREYVE